MEYTTLEAAIALGTTPKLLDNVLTREARHLIASGMQGKSRIIDEPLIEVLAVALLLRRDLGVPLRRSIAIATRILASGSSEVAVGSLVSIRFDVPVLRRVLRQALADALQDRTQTPRGRPRTQAKRGASL